MRFAFGRASWSHVSEDVFAVDGPATNGDLPAALYALTGGECDPNEALAAFAEYGLVSGDVDRAHTSPAAPGDVWARMSAVFGKPLIETTRPGASTRGELAEALMAIAGDSGEAQ